VRVHIGIFGGTFDPPHIGHLIVATHVRRALGFNVLKLVVANNPWQKSDLRQVTPAQHRLEMVKLAVEPYDGVEASDIEIRRGGSSYSIDTVEAALDDGATAVDLIVGRDAARGLDTWHRAEELRDMVTIVIVGRPGSSGDAPPRWRTRYVAVPQVDVSSTDLRRRLADDDTVDVLIAPAVVDYIERLDLYPPPT